MRSKGRMRAPASCPRTLTRLDFVEPPSPASGRGDFPRGAPPCRTCAGVGAVHSGAREKQGRRGAGAGAPPQVANADQNIGIGAGGGFPQWNCNCANCRAVRAGAPGFKARTQSSLAVSANGADWVLLNASPDLREQIAKAPQLWPRESDGVRASPIKAVAVSNGDVDHVTGLLNLREAQPFALYGSARCCMCSPPTASSMSALATYVPRREVPLDAPVPLQDAAGADLGLSLRAFPVPGKIALWLEDLNAPNFGTSEGDTLGFEITETSSGKSFFYIPGCAHVRRSWRSG